MNAESATLHTTAGEDDFLATVRDCLRQRPRAIPPRFFYDAIGSQLFDAICTTPEYYLTRTEIGILDQFCEQMVELIGRSCTLIELGCGSASKTQRLLRYLADGAVYVPIDICGPLLLQSTQRLRAMFPAIRMQPICADYTRLSGLELDADPGRRRAVFFPGSTIGNHTPDESV